MNEKTVIDKVCKWFTEKNPNNKCERQKNYKISPSILNLNKPCFRADIVITDNVSGKQIGIECKSLKDSNQFRKLAAGVGQTYILQRVFGLSYLAIEVESSIAENRFELNKRSSFLENASRELGFGILFVGNNVECVRETRYEEPRAKNLFIPMKR